MSGSADESEGLDGARHLLERWGVITVALASIGAPELYTFDDDGASYDDGGGNRAALALPGAGRAVFHGYDHEYSDTSDRPAGAPEPADVDPRGFRLLALAHSGSLDTDAVEAFAQLRGPPAPEAVSRAMTIAVAVGLCPGSSSPLERPARPAPSRPPRRRRRLSEAQHERLVFDAMRTATEAPRSIRRARRETKRLVGWLQGHGHLHPGGPGVGLQICAGGATVQHPGPGNRRSRRVHRRRRPRHLEVPDHRRRSRAHLSDRGGHRLRHDVRRLGSDLTPHA